MSHSGILEITQTYTYLIGGKIQTIIKISCIFVDSLTFSTYKVMLSVNRNNFTSFPILTPFVSFYCLIALKRTSNTI